MPLLLQDPLQSKDKGITTIWLLATLGSRSGYTKITKKDIEEFNIPKTCNTLQDPQLKFSLRQTSCLLYGVTLVYKQKLDYSYREANSTKLLFKRGLSQLSSKTRIEEINGQSIPNELQNFRPNLFNHLLRDDPNFDIDVRFTLNPLVGLENLRNIKRFDLGINATVSNTNSIIEDYSIEPLGVEKNPNAEMTMINHEDNYDGFDLDEDLNIFGDKGLDFIFDDNGDAVMVEDTKTADPLTTHSKLTAIAQNIEQEQVAYDNNVDFSHIHNDERILPELDYENGAEGVAALEESMPPERNKSKRKPTTTRGKKILTGTTKRFKLVQDEESRMRISELKESRENYVEIRNEARNSALVKQYATSTKDPFDEWFYNYQSLEYPISRLALAKAFVSDFAMSTDLLKFHNRDAVNRGEFQISNSSRARSSSVTSIEEARRATITSSRRSSVSRYENDFDAMLDNYEVTGNDAILDITWGRHNNGTREFSFIGSEERYQAEENDIDEEDQVKDLRNALAFDKDLLSSRPTTRQYNDRMTRIKRRKIQPGVEDYPRDPLEPANKDHSSVHMDSLDDMYAAHPPVTAISYFSYDNSRLRYIDRTARKFFRCIQAKSRDSGDSLDYEILPNSSFSSSQTQDPSGLGIELKEITFDKIIPDGIRRKLAAEATQKMLLLATKAMLQIEVKPDHYANKWDTLQAHNISIIVNVSER